VPRIRESIVEAKTCKKAKVMSAFISAGIYAILIGSPLSDPKSRDVMEKAFAQAPLGFSPMAFSIVVQTVLFLPMPFIFFHLMKLQLVSNASGSYRAFTLQFLFQTWRDSPELRPSVYACIAGVLYWFSIGAVWIWHTNRLGI
jgi:hypothetical protein